MKILFLAKTLAGSGGGAERVLSTVTGGLAGKGHDIVVASFDEPGLSDFYEFNPSVRRISLGVGNTLVRSGILDIVRRTRSARRLIEAESPDVTIGFMHSAYILLGLASIGYATPVVASEHIVYDHYRRHPIQRILLLATAPLAAAFTGISEAVRAGFPEVIRNKMAVLPNPVSRPAKSQGRRDSCVILSVGRLEKQKDQRTLIAAFTSIADEFPDWTLRIIGEGQLRSELESQVRETGVDSRISLPGATTDIHREYESAGLFVLPSLYESFGLATAEALSHGLPVIGFSDCPGTNELVQDGVNGVLVAGENRVAALAEALRRLMNSPEARELLGRAGPGSVHQFSEAVVVDKWESLLGNVARFPQARISSMVA